MDSYVAILSENSESIPNGIYLELNNLLMEIYKGNKPIEEFKEQIKIHSESLPQQLVKKLLQSGEMNETQQEIYNFAKKGSNIFITGGAGTGKSYLVEHLSKYFAEQGINYAITAMTGTAAVIINGRTLHSFLGIGLGKGTPIDLYNRVRKQGPMIESLIDLETLIIDEVSMLSAELFDNINELLQKVRRSYKPFGGLQLILVGDICQLPPVEGNYIFTSKFWNTFNFKVKILTENMRISSHDLQFKEIVDRLRWGKFNTSDYSTLEKLKNNKFPAYVKPTRLFSKNNDVIKINDNEFNLLVESGAVVKEYPVRYKTSLSQKYLETHKMLESIKLCVGAQIIVTRNVDTSMGIVNGTRGIVLQLNIDSILIRNTKGYEVVIDYYVVTPDRFDKNTHQIEYSHLPVKLGWAVSIHSSQGMTIDALEVDLGNSIFSYGQAYTGISRARSMDSIKIIKLSKSSFKTSPLVIDFYNKYSDNGTNKEKEEEIVSTGCLFA